MASKLDPETVDIANKQLVATRGDIIVVGLHTPSFMTTEDAVVHTAWVLAMAFCNGVTKKQFDRVLERVLNT